MQRVAQHEKIYNDLLQEIQKGSYKEGQLLPSEHELCRLYSVSRPTVRQAMQRLSDSGYVIKHHGKGSIVLRTKMSLGVLSPKGTSESLKDYQLVSKILSFNRVKELPEALVKIEDVQDDFIVIERIRSVEGIPCFYEKTWLPATWAANINRKKVEEEGLFAAIFYLTGAKIVGGKQTMQVAEAYPSLKKIMNLKENTALLYIKRQILTQVSDMRFFSELYCDTSRFELEESF